MFACLGAATLADDADDEPLVDLGGFGSEQPEEPVDHPDQGQLVFRADDAQNRVMEHWDQYDWTFDAVRGGDYRLVMRYRLDLTSLGVQFHHTGSGSRLRSLLRHTGRNSSATVELGEVTLEEGGSTGFSIYTPSMTNPDAFEIIDLRWIPTSRVAVEPPDERGVVVLPAEAAVTWSKTMGRIVTEDGLYLGDWTDSADWAEWTFLTNGKGTYNVVVHKGCGDDCAGAEVALLLGDDEVTRFTVASTGGDRQWRAVPVTSIQLDGQGPHTLSLRPLAKPGSTVMQLLKVELVPSS